VKKYCWYAYR